MSWIYKSKSTYKSRTCESNSAWCLSPESGLELSLWTCELSQTHKLAQLMWYASSVIQAKFESGVRTQTRDSNSAWHLSPESGLKLSLWTCELSQTCKLAWLVWHTSTIFLQHVIDMVFRSVDMFCSHVMCSCWYFCSCWSCVPLSSYYPMVSLIWSREIVVALFITAGSLWAGGDAQHWQTDDDTEGSEETL